MKPLTKDERRLREAVAMRRYGDELVVFISDKKLREITGDIE